jgi:hypothetical protein
MVDHRVATGEPERTSDDLAESESAAGIVGRLRPVEFLPHSRAVWNQHGKPARWRNLRRAA